MCEAKFRLSIKEGVFEFEGSEEFVTNQIENFKSNIFEVLKGNNFEDDLPEAAPLPSKIENDSCEMQRKSYERVLHIEDQDVRIIKTMPGDNNAHKSVNTALAYLWGKRSIGIDEVPLQEIRSICQQQGCLDTTNFSTTMQRTREYLIIDGKKGSSSKTCKLTFPGVERAEELLENLNGE